MKRCYQCSDVLLTFTWPVTQIYVQLDLVYARLPKLSGILLLSKPELLRSVRLAVFSACRSSNVFDLWQRRSDFLGFTAIFMLAGVPGLITSSGQ